MISSRGSKLAGFLRRVSMLSSGQMTVLFFAMYEVRGFRGEFIFFLTKEGLGGSEPREILREGGGVKVQVL